MRRYSLALPVLVLIGLLLGGCASTGMSGSNDPLQGYNRAMFAFNMAVDKHALRPVAKAYAKVAPSFLRGRVSDFFSNLGDVSTTVNAALQGKPQALGDLTRFLMNTTFGLGGLFDVATPLGLPAHHEDIGMTLATWGVPEGPYVVLPFFGPSTLRNAPAPVIDGYFFNPLTYYPRPLTDEGLAVLDVVNLRAKLLPFDSLIDQSPDPYIYVKEVYLQQRRYLLEQNNPKPANKKPSLTSLQKQLLEMESPDAGS